MEWVFLSARYKVPARTNRHDFSAVAFLPVPLNARDVGECIYCGTQEEPLNREHAVPFGLNGPWTLLRASCVGCASTTHRFERDTLRSLWPGIRNVLAMQSRRRRERDKTLPLVIQRAGVQEVVQIPPSEFPLYLPTPMFPPPGVVAGRKPMRGIFSKLDLIRVAGPTFEEVSGRYPGAEFVGARANFSPEEFARMLAKIALCGAVYALGVAPFGQTPIRRVILGKDPNIGDWVGSWEGDPVNEAKGLHAMQVRASGSDIHVILRLFAQFGAPEYHVALGAADPKFVASSEWPWK